METVGERLRWARERQLLTQEALAARAGVLDVTISRTENGHTTPTVGTLRKLADALGVDPVWLRFGEGEPWGEAAA